MSDYRTRTRAAVAAIAALLVPGAVAAQQHHGAGAASDSMAMSQMGPCDMMSHGMMTTGGMAHGDMMQGRMAAGGQSGGMMMTMWGGDIMSQVMRFQPAAVLGQREALALTARQVTRLEELVTASQSAHQGSMPAMREAAAKLEEAFVADPPNPAAVRRAAVAAMRPHSEMHASMVADAATVRALLDPTQREAMSELQPQPSCPMDPGPPTGQGGSDIP